MDWLTSNSRQVFGVILERCITIVLDCGGMLEEELNLCRDALVMVLQEQVAHIAKFNIIWVSQEPVKWQEGAVPVTAQSIAAAVSWVEKSPFELALSQASRLDALLEAGKDESVSVCLCLLPRHEGGFALISSHSVSACCLPAELGPFQLHPAETASLAFKSP
uniref:Uncharacterized protein n=1 Tax=Monodon monoceros TaxID=40151 RepID=A0A8C6BWV7_MONMO